MDLWQDIFGFHIKQCVLIYGEVLCYFLVMFLEWLQRSCFDHYFQSDKNESLVFDVKRLWVLFGFLKKIVKKFLRSFQFVSLRFIIIKLLIKNYNFYKWLVLIQCLLYSFLFAFNIKQWFWDSLLILNWLISIRVLAYNFKQ
jgi:hypothetical protein